MQNVVLSVMGRSAYHAEIRSVGTAKQNHVLLDCA
jgi:hypothetical protein